MSDRFDYERCIWNMSRIRGKDTKPIIAITEDKSDKLKAGKNGKNKDDRQQAANRVIRA